MGSPNLKKIFPRGPVQKENLRKDILSKESSPGKAYELYFSHIVQQKGKEPVFALLNLEKEFFIAGLMESSGVQDAFRFRAKSRALQIASYLINEKGEFCSDHLVEVIRLLEKQGPIPFPRGESDFLLHKHLLSCLMKWKENPYLTRLLKKFQKPLCHRWAEKIVKDTLGLPEQTPLSDAHIRISVLASTLTFLRQSVGSCFATAPAILIGQEQMENLLLDLLEMLSTGRLKKIIQGKEYSVPLSPSYGVGDLKKMIGLESTLFSPGILFALEAADIVVKESSLQQQREKIRALLIPLFEQKDSLSVENILRHILFTHYGIKEEDLFSFEKIEKQLGRRGLVSGFISHEAVLSKKNEACIAFLAAEKKVKAAFLSLADNLLLKAWEFTLASFSEVKMEFSRWNMYASLGYDPKEQGGIGEVIVTFIDTKIKKSNEKLEDLQRDYELAFDHLRGTETLLKRASSAEEAARLKVEYQSRYHHMHACLELRDKFYKRASQFSNLYSFLVKQFDEKFPEYFQEIYDAEMQDVHIDHLYDDSPAGFRLVYKHGRSDASLWSLIHSPAEYIDCLTAFFSIIEPQVVALCEWEGAENDIKEVFSLLISHVREERFLQTAIMRMAKAHNFPLKGDPLKQIEKMEKKPWAYTSGGTMNTLLKTYYKREADMTEEHRKVESEQELLIFLIDAIKNISYQTTLLYAKDRNKGLLMSSPTHAFVMYPGWEEYKKGWEDPIFTYSWVRDQFINPSRQFYSSITLSADEQRFLAELFESHISTVVKKRITLSFSPLGDSCSIQEFRKELAEKHFPSSVKSTLLDELDALLFRELPLFSGDLYKHHLEKVLSPVLDTRIRAEIFSFLPDRSQEIFSARMLRDYAKLCLLAALDEYPFDIHFYVASRASELKLSSPRPLFFADTNWSENYFAFVVNPGNEQLELWRVKPSGAEGVKMSAWDSYLKGQGKDSWSVYCKPEEYSTIFEYKI